MRDFKKGTPDRQSTDGSRFTVHVSTVSCSVVREPYGWSQKSFLNGRQEGVGTREPGLPTKGGGGAGRTVFSIKGFTLIELMIVIAIIALLAGMIFPVTAAVNRAKIKARSRADLAMLQTAIESYKAKLGHYPPDARNAITNQLYYELLGSSAISSGPNHMTYTTLDGSAKLGDTVIGSLFGTSGFINASKGAGSDESVSAFQFLRSLRPDQVGILSNSIANGKTSEAARIIVGYPWKKIPNSEFSDDPLPNNPGLNPWRYRAHDNANYPLNNSGGFDLWIDVNIGGTVFRICNWSAQPLKVTSPLRYQ